ncbi:MAG: hypothetical protein ACJ74Z_06900 [Bryobacteraceae bacterium]
MFISVGLEFVGALPIFRVPRDRGHQKQTDLGVDWKIRLINV